jgi:hypothetical protein
MGLEVILLDGNANAVRNFYMQPKTLKAIRVLHLYSGVFLAPAILFFAFTGFLQTFSFHESSHGPGYVPPAIFVRLSRLHKKATLDIPPPKPAPKAAPKPEPSPAPTAPKTPATPGWKEHLPMKLFFSVVAFGLMLSTFSGLVMSWKYARNKMIPSAIFLAGILVPLLLLLL